MAALTSLFLALVAVGVFVFAVKKDYFRNIEDAKYQVFWSDLDEQAPGARENRNDGGDAQS